MHECTLDKATCPLCGNAGQRYASVEGVAYFECSACDFIYADPAVLADVDSGDFVRSYDSSYWEAELRSARRRSYGSSLARAAEALLYCRVPVNRFVDIGTGPGYLLDALSTYLPAASNRFFGVEKYPPGDKYCSKHENYMRADLRDVGLRFECGVCIEVIEHLTPAMARNLASAMASVSVPGSLFLFNTGLTDYVRNEDPGYLDPHRRGHITSWSVRAARQIFEPLGFSVYALRGKTWAFIVEMPGPETNVPMRDRVWTAPVENRNLLSDPGMGEVMYILGRESALAF